MGLLDGIWGIFRPKSFGQMSMDELRDAKGRAEVKKAEAQLRLARERDRASPDVLRIDQLERQVSTYESVLVQIREEIGKRGGFGYPPKGA